MHIESYRFGRLSIDGQVYTRDLKIIGQGVLPDWRRKGGHRVVYEDVQDILLAQPGLVVFGTGKLGLMRLDPELRALFQGQGLELIEQPTAQAIQTINGELDKGSHLAAGLHLTC